MRYLQGVRLWKRCTSTHFGGNSHHVPLFKARARKTLSIAQEMMVLGAGVGIGAFAAWNVTIFLLAPLVQIEQHDRDENPPDMEVNLSEIEEGECKKILWGNKVVVIRHRASEQIQKARSVPLSSLMDPEADEHRVQAGHEHFVVLFAECTHAACLTRPEGNVFVCPCHGAEFDDSGRVTAGPARMNLKIPPYAWKDEETIVLGRIE